MTANDKQMYKRYNAEQGGTPHDLQALSPPQTFLGTSPAQGCLRYLGKILVINFIFAKFIIIGLMPDTCFPNFRDKILVLAYAC